MFSPNNDTHRCSTEDEFKLNGQFENRSELQHWAISCVFMFSTGLAAAQSVGT